MKEAIINYINARAERLKPCTHNFSLDMEVKTTSNYPIEEYHKHIYFCTKCGKQITIKSNH